MKVATMIEANGGKSASCPNTSAQMDYFEDLLVKKGIDRAYTIGDADYVVYASCAFDGKTLKRVEDRIKKLVSIPHYYPEEANYKLIIVGCITKVCEFEGMEKITDNVFKIGDEAFIINDPVWSKVALNLILDEKKDVTISDRFLSNTHRYGNSGVFDAISIVKGCTNKCAFCKTNYMDNKIESLPYHELLSYLRNLIKNGAKVLDFHGDTLNLYGVDLYGKPILHKLLHEISKEKDLKMIHLGEVTVRNMYKELLDEICNNPKINVVTLQLESASNEVLKNMNRGTTIEEYDDVASTILNRGKFIDTILMSGYPYETYEDLDKTFEYVKSRGIHINGVCEYIDSEYVPSHKLDQYSGKEKKAHTKYLVEKLRPYNFSLMNNSLDKMENAIIYGKHEDAVFAVSGTNFFACSNLKRHKELDLGDTIEERPKRFVKRSKFVRNKDVFKY